MVGAPVSYSGNHPQPHPSMGGNPAGFNADTSQRHSLATPNAPISILLPYNGQLPQSSSQPCGYPAPPGQGMMGNNYPPNANYPPTPHPSNPQPSSAYPNYPPTSHPSNPQPSSSYHPQVSAPPPLPPFSVNNQYPPSSMGQQPSAPYNPGYTPTSSPFPNTYPPNSSGMNQPQPSAYPPTAYPPQATNPQPPIGYPQGQSTGTYPPGPATSAYPPTNPTSQAPNPMGTYPYPGPQSGGALYPPRY